MWPPSGFPSPKASPLLSYENIRAASSFHLVAMVIVILWMSMSTFPYSMRHPRTMIDQSTPVELGIEAHNGAHLIMVIHISIEDATLLVMRVLGLELGYKSCLYFARNSVKMVPIAQGCSTSEFGGCMLVAGASPSSYDKYIDFLIAQQSDSQTSAAAAFMTGEELYNFGRGRQERNDFLLEEIY
ncbi:zinc finger CCCH domain-containing protein 55 isoform X1 [Sesbania bispinosa]|nr:zinc finger CCCH domain-containing protein 55 isoform X1 [Sesbania bispinosa]